MKYRKKPVVVEAIRWDGDNLEEIATFMGKYTYSNKLLPCFSLTIFTLGGRMDASIGDYIIKGIKGEFYPCKPDIFEQTYEAI